LKEKLEKLTDYKWQLPETSREGMRVKAIIYGNKQIIDQAEDDAVTQLTNVACLPGVIEPVIAMPDFHWGYQV